MSEPGAKLWLIQVDSDLVAAERVWDPQDHRTFCQVLAKYQQAVEKSVKAIVAVIKEIGVALPPIGYRHDLSRHLEAIDRLPKAHRGVQNRVNGLLTHYHRAEIDAISALVPRMPDASTGQLHRLNTEYPYEVARDQWAVPAQAGTFSESQVRRFAALSHYVFFGACKIVSALSH